MKKFLLMTSAAFTLVYLSACCGVKKDSETAIEPVPADTVATATDTICSARWMKGSEVRIDPAGEGATRQVMGYNKDVMLVKVMFETGGVGAMHQHVNTQTTYVASGKFEFTIGDETKIVEAGDALYMEPNIMHGCKCLEKGVLIDVFNPYRADFLK